MELLKAGAEKLGLFITERQMEKFEAYYREMIAWNQRVNLTAITGYEEAQLNHFLDSLTVIPALGKPSGSVLDVGTGAGLPGVPLKILFPEIRLCLIDATAKKTDFLTYIVHKLDLDHVEIITARAEEAARKDDYRERFGIVLSRAVAPLAALYELALPFCAVGGSFIAHKRGDIEKEINDAKNALGILGGRLREVKKIDLPEFPDNRCLIVIDKISPTPEKYPRRPGMPEKRPL
jgi:16S rRNA (guanine527-N7)-methyltransferase